MKFSVARLLGFIPLAVLGLQISPAAAQTADQVIDSLSMMVGTLGVSTEPVMSEGALVGCTLVFNALYQDWAYRGGAFLKVTGSVGLVSLKNTLGTNLKVVVFEIDPSDSSSAMTPSPPSRAYLLGSSFETNLPSLIESTESDTPGALFSIFQLSPTMEMILTGLQENLLTIAFNSKGGSTDLRLPIELDVVDFQSDGTRVRSRKTSTDFATCALALMDDYQ